MYYTTVGGERKHANVRIVEWKVALLLRGEQTIDKEKDIKGARSYARVLNSGLEQNQPIRGVLYSI